MAQAVFPNDALPPEGTYNSRESLLETINSWAKPRGYAFTTGKSSKTSNGRVRVVFACDRNGQPPSTSTERKRRTCTRGTGCKFSVLAKQSLDGNSWTLRHRQDQGCSEHNHQPSQDPSAHPAHRHLTRNDRCTVTSLANAGIAPKDIRTYLRQNSDTIATQQDIYNRIAESKRELCEGQSTIQALANQLDNEGFWCRMQLDSDGRVTAVLFAHPDSLAYLQAYPDLLFLDCTYKTNRYGMPLLDMIGVDACERSFCIAFAFLSGETEEDYIWALDRLRSVYETCGARLPSVILTDRCIACLNAVSFCFPLAISLLCLWHANKAVLRYCKPTFTCHKEGSEAYKQGEANWNDFFSHWHAIVGSADEETFGQRVQEMEKRYVPQYLEEVGYIKANWLDLHKEKLVKAWVDQHPHFGNVVTSRVEGIHALLKSHLKKSTLDLFEAWRAMKQALLNQLAELQYNQAKQQIRIPIELSGLLYSAVRGWISHEALRKVEEQRKRISAGDLPRCTGAFTRSQGLPCAHTVRDLQEQGQALSLGHFHTQWHLKRGGTHRPLLEPRHRADRVAISSTIPQSSTRREPSAFEAVEAAGKPKAQPTCSRCHTLGHTMTSRVCPLRHQDLIQAAETAADQAAADQVAADQAAAVQQATDHTMTAHAATIQTAIDQTATIHVAITQTAAAETAAIQTAVDQTATDLAATIHVAAEQAAAGELSTIYVASDHTTVDQPASALHYSDPQAIYQRYVRAREDWYKAQPRGSLKTNQQYRKAMGLPQRYKKSSYEWCLDYKYMGQCCKTSTGARDWTKEEMMAYLDWTEAEDNRVEAQVAAEMQSNRWSRGRRGMDDIWGAAERDCDEQQQIWEAATRESE